MFEVDTIAKYTSDTRPWGFRNSGSEAALSNDTLISVTTDRSTVLKIKLPDSFTTWTGLKRETSERQARVELLPCGYEVSASASPRGQHRPGLPMLALRSNSFEAVHIILEDLPNTDLGPISDLSGQTPAHVFQAEKYAYLLASHLSDFFLTVGTTRVILEDIAQETIETNALILEDFHAAKERLGAIARQGLKPAFEAADVFNLYLIQSLVGNADYFFDFRDFGGFHSHNVEVFCLDGLWIPVPFDFQFSIFAAPRHKRYPRAGVEEYARSVAEFLSGMLQHLSGLHSVDFVYQAIASARSMVEASITEPELKMHYSTYLEILEHNVTATRSLRNK